jgi:hypothetical protein
MKMLFLLLFERLNYYNFLIKDEIPVVLIFIIILAIKIIRIIKRIAPNINITVKYLLLFCVNFNILSFCSAFFINN